MKFVGDYLVVNCTSQCSVWPHSGGVAGMGLPDATEVVLLLLCCGGGGGGGGVLGCSTGYK